MQTVSTRNNGADIQIAPFHRKRLGVIAALVMILASPYQTYAQSAYSTDPVIVDLSVLQDNGTGIGTNGLTINRPGGIKKPPATVPTSRLLVRPKSPIPNLTQKDLKIKLPPLVTHKTKKPKHIDAGMPKTKIAKAKAVKKMAVTTPTVAAPAVTAPVETVMAPAPPSLPQITAAPVKPVKTETPAPAAMPEKPEQLDAQKQAPAVPVIKDAPKELVVSAAPPLPPVTKKAPEPEPVAVAAAPKNQPEQAALPEGQVLSVVFKAKSGRLSSDAKKGLMEIAKKYENNKTVRLQLKAYAGGKDLSVIKAKRLSLTRALAVRSYMIGRGMRGARIDVRALGNQTTDTPFDRVDVNVIQK